MDLNKNLQKMSLTKIQEMIAIFELRIRINTQLIVPIENISMPASSSGLSLISTLESVYANNQRAEQIINCCNNSIKKLMLFSTALPNLKQEDILSLFDQYGLYSPEEFHALLNKTRGPSKLIIN